MRRPVLEIVQDQFARNRLGLIRRITQLSERKPPLPGQKVGCLVWRGSINNDSYAKMNFLFKGSHVQVYAHIVTWVLANGRSVEYGFELDHVCNLRKCIEPSHLEEVTHSENQLRAARRRRPTREETQKSIDEGMAHWRRLQEEKHGQVQQANR